MLGLPLGIGASFLLSGLVAEWTGGWRGGDAGRRRAGVPARSAGAPAAGARARRGGSASRGSGEQNASEAVRAVLAVPTMRWIIASGALLNLMMYALAAFVTSFLVRYHGLGLGPATRVSGAVYAVGGTRRDSRGRLDGGPRARGRGSTAGSGSPPSRSRLGSAGLAGAVAGARRGARLRRVPHAGLHLLLLLLPVGLRDDPGRDRAEDPGDGDGRLLLRLLHLHGRGPCRVRPTERRAGRAGARAGSHGGGSERAGPPRRDVFAADPGVCCWPRALGRDRDTW